MKSLPLSNIAELRTFAFLLLFSVTSQKQLKKDPKLLDVALDVAKGCLHAESNELARTVLEHTATLLSALMLTEEPHAEYVRRHQNIQHHALRVLLHFRDRRFDLADFAYQSIQQDLAKVDDEAVLEKTVDVCFEMGKACLEAKDLSVETSQNAVLWLGRAKDVLCHESCAAFGGTDLRLNVLHRYAQALASSTVVEHRAEAETTIGQLRHEYGPKLSILLLSLENCFSQQPPKPAEIISENLRPIIETAHTLETNYRLIIHYVHKFIAIDRKEASSCLMQYILGRLIPEKKTELVEQAVVQYISIAIEETRDLAERARSLQKDLDDILASLSCPLSCRAAQAAQVLIWRIIHKSDQEGSRSTSLLWCQIGIHQLFSQTGEAIQGKIERRMISYHLLVSNTDAAQELLSHMSINQRHDKYTKLLEFSLAVASGQDIKAQTCLKTILNSSGDHDDLLFACVGETVKHGRHLETAKLLQRLLDRHVRSNASKIDKEKLLKCTIQALLQAIEQEHRVQPSDELLYRLCAVFKAIVRQHEHSRTNGNPDANFEWKWFHEQSFLVARTNAKVWPRKYIIDLLSHSRDLGPDSASSTLNEEVRLYDIAFLQAILLAAEARNITLHYSIEDLPITVYNSREKPQSHECRYVLYKRLFEIFSALRGHYEGITIKPPDNLTRQMHVLVPLAFEALIYVSCFDYGRGESSFNQISVKQFLTDCKELNVPAATYALLADVLLTFVRNQQPGISAHIPSPIIINILGTVIDALRKNPTYNMEQAGRWLMCVAQLVFDDIDYAMSRDEKSQSRRCDKPLNELSSVLDQLTVLLNATQPDATMESLVHAGQKRKRDAGVRPVYLADEVQWLLTMTFNLITQFADTRQDKLVKEWAQRVIDMAEAWAGGCHDNVASSFLDTIVKRMFETGWAKQHGLRIPDLYSGDIELWDEVTSSWKEDN